MTDVPPSPPGFGAQQPPSVVVDTNAKVNRSRLGVIVGVLVAMALVAGFAVWFVMADSEEYKPGPEALAVVAGLSDAGIEIEFTDAELKCIDGAFAGADLSMVESDFDPFAYGYEDDLERRIGIMYDDCLAQASRVELIAESAFMEGLGDAEQTRCAAEAMHDLIASHGGYGEATSAAIDLSEELFAAFADCGIDVSGA